MRTDLRAPLVAAVLLVAGCQQDPAGRCADHAGCNVGEECVDGICARLETDHQVGSRCIRDADCVAWASCAQEACALRPGMCTSSADCAPVWQVCSAGHACATAPGHCGGEAECAAWQDCDLVDHTCALTPGMCADGTDCAAWQECDVAHTCVTGQGFCALEADCETWQDCGLDHLCALAPGRCETGADCASWDVCDATNTCVHGPGYCDTSAECAGWQECDAVHACVTAPGYCAGSQDCAAWQTCGPDHLCALTPGMCETGAECASWQLCDASHLCATAPGRCASTAECHPPQTCVSNTCEDAPPGAFDTSTVLLFGTLSEGSGPHTVARLEAPTVPYAGFGVYTDLDTAFLNPMGEVVYRQHEFDSGDRQRLRVFHSESFWWDAELSMWRPPSSHFANDPEIPTPACDAAIYLNLWTMQGGTGEILYACGGTTYYDTAGAQRLTGYEILSWNANGTMLVTTVVASVRVWLLLDAAGAEVPITGLSLGPSPLTGRYFVSARTHSDGFRVVTEGPPLTRSLWFVDSLGVATEIGTYPDLSAYNAWDLTLDAAGSLYAHASLPYSLLDTVQRCTIGSAACTEVYTEAGAPLVGWWTTDPPSFFVYIHGGNPLVTAP